MSIISLTEDAIHRIRILNERGGGRVLRLSTSTAGCSGHKYVFDYADEAGEHDERVESSGAVVFIDPMSLIHVLGTRVDWIEDGLERKFVFENPNAIGQCGCGESFAVAG